MKGPNSMNKYMLDAFDRIRSTKWKNMCKNVWNTDKGFFF